MVVLKRSLQSSNKLVLFSVLLQQNSKRVAQWPEWVFGMVDTSFQPARGYMEIASRRDRVTLTFELNTKLEAKSIIHPDEWQRYLHLPHFVMNHTLNFVDYVTDTHTQVSINFCYSICVVLVYRYCLSSVFLVYCF